MRLTTLITTSKFLRTYNISKSIEIIRALFYILIIILLSLFYHTYKVKVAKLNSPTWADFTTIGTWDERIIAVNSQGVPNTLDINGEQWNVIKIDHFNDVEKKGAVKDGKIVLPSIITAETFCNNKTIAYISDADHNQLRADIMHEIFHAGGCLHGGDTYWNSINPTEKDHPGIYHLGEFTASFMRTNPRFTEWVSQ
jgi:hypothetical protein